MPSGAFVLFGEFEPEILNRRSGGQEVLSLEKRILLISCSPVKNS
jgi:hypothetical protein